MNDEERMNAEHWIEFREKVVEEYVKLNNSRIEKAKKMLDDGVSFEEFEKNIINGYQTVDAPVLTDDEVDRLISEVDAPTAGVQETETIEFNSMTASEKLLDNGYDGVVVFENDSYDDALIGVSDDNRAVYSYSRMIDWLMKRDGISADEAIEWIDYNTIRALSYAGAGAPIVVYDLD